MNQRQATELFRKHRVDGDYASAQTVMLEWARETGKPHDLWHANMALLHFAFDLGLYQEALDRAEDLKKIDAEDPYLLEILSRICEAQGRHGEAITYAERAVKCAEVTDTLNREGYREYLARLRARDDRWKFHVA